MKSSLSWPGAPMALASAALFGASTPLAKLLLGDGVDAWLLAGLLYLGSGVGLGLVHLTRGLLGVPAPEARCGGATYHGLAWSSWPAGSLARCC